jgi:hypothetical protein
MLTLGLGVFVDKGLGGPPWLAPAVLAGTTILLAALGAPGDQAAQAVPTNPGTRRGRGTVGGVLPGCAGLGSKQLEWVIPALIVATLLYAAADVMHALVSMGLARALSLPTARGRYLAVFRYSFTIANMIAPACSSCTVAAVAGLGLLHLGALAGMLMLERIVPDSAQRIAEPARV